MSFAEYLEAYHKEEAKTLTTAAKRKTFLVEKGVKIQPDEDGVPGVAIKIGKKMLTGKETSLSQSNQEDFESKKASSTK